MAYLNYLSDEDYIRLVKEVLDLGRKKKANIDKEFHKNVIDPFSAIINAAVFEIDHQTWYASETIRQCQKTLQNHIGELHQKILGCALGWHDLGKGSIVDLVCEKRKIIAEVKNKHNTVTGGKLVDDYHSLEDAVTPKLSQYKDFTAYFVNIVPKNSARFNKPFEPSDKKKGMKCAKNESIRIIDGASFYHLVTGEQDALQKLYDTLPVVIEHIFKHDYHIDNFVLEDKAMFADYFDKAYIPIILK